MPNNRDIVFPTKVDLPECQPNTLYRVMYIVINDAPTDLRTYEDFKQAAMVQEYYPEGRWNVYTSYGTSYEACRYDMDQAHRTYNYPGSVYIFLMVPAPERFPWMAAERAKIPERGLFEHQAEDFHLAYLTDKCMISFFESENKGSRGIRTEMKLGRYLRRFCGFGDNEVSDIAARYGAELGDSTLKFARTREEIRNVYVNGPRSCMSGDIKYGNHPDHQAHPTEVYASEDLAVAYLERDGDITARTVVNMKNKRFLGIYGDSTRLHTLLSKEGYTHSSSALGGCRLLKIYGDPNQKTFIMPYLDGNCHQIDPLPEDPDHVLIIAPPRTINGSGGGVYNMPED